MREPTDQQRATLLRMLDDQLGAHGPVTRGEAAEAAAYWILLIQPTPNELREILARFPETLPPDPPINGWQAGGPAAICQHCQSTVAVVGGRLVSHKRPTGDHCRDSGRSVDQS